MVRLFVAIDLPDQIRTDLHKLALHIGKVKPVKRKQLHLTLKFIGSLPAEDSRILQKQLQAIFHQSFNLQIQSVGKFPQKGSPKVIWAGFKRSPELMSLNTKLELLIDTTAVTDQSNFIPHVTLTRIKRTSQAGTIQQFLQKYQSYSLSPFPVTDFTLYASTLTPEGAIHAPLGKYRLR